MVSAISVPLQVRRDFNFSDQTTPSVEREWAEPTGRHCAFPLVMPRRLNWTADIVFHVMNRGVRRSNIFESAGDYAAFLAVLREAGERVPMRLLSFALMRNHWHLVLWPRNNGDLTRYVGWATLTHACRWQRIHETRGTGPVYQGRFKAIPVQPDHHLLTVCRYVERNPVRAGFVTRAQDWLWSSASETQDADWPTRHEWPIDKPPNWIDVINEADQTVALETLRACVARSAPYGTDEWRTNHSRSTPGVVPRDPAYPAPDRRRPTCRGGGRAWPLSTQ